MKPDKAKRLRLLQRIAENQQNGEFPLVRELAQSLGYKGESSITRMLDALVQEGYLQKQGGGRERLDRLYQITPKARQLLATSVHAALPAHPSHPLLDSSALESALPESALLESLAPRFSALTLPVLGSIPAGPLGEAVQECDEFAEPGDYLRAQINDFFLRVRGKSMTGDGILPGDLVLLRPGVQINNGEIAAVQIHGPAQTEATLKHVHYQANKRLVRLRASNPRYEEVRVPAEEVNIVGVYRGLLRRSS